MMQWFIAIAISLSLGGSVAAPVATILLKGYKEEREKLLTGSSSRTERVVDQPTYEVEDAPKKAQRRVRN